MTLESPHLFALLERVHGHLGWLGLAVLLHPVITLRLRRGVTRGTRLSVVLAALLMAAPYALGWVIYPTYRASVKPRLLLEARGWALAFETKEHLAFFALALTLAGAGTLLAAPRSPHGREAAWALLAAGWLCGVVVGVLGSLIAGRAHPAW